MMWFSLAFLTAFFESLKDIFGKKGLRTSDEYVVAWTLSFFSAILLMPFVLSLHLPDLGRSFWLSLIVASALNTIASILYIKALKTSDLSLALPMLALTPLFLVLTSPVIVGEWPNAFDFIGIVLIVSGSYLLNIRERRKGYLAPFRALFEQRGPKMMLGVTLIWSISGNLDKVGVQNSSPIIWLFGMFCMIAVVLLPLMLLKSQQPARQFIQGLPILLPMAICNTLAVLFQMQALTLTLVVQVVAIKRTSVLWGVLWGHLLFQEQRIRERMLGASTMISGVLVITLF